MGVTGGKVACSWSNKTVGVATTEETCSQSTKTVCARGVAKPAMVHPYCVTVVRVDGVLITCQYT